MKRKPDRTRKGTAMRGQRAFEALEISGLGPTNSERVRQLWAACRALDDEQADAKEAIEGAIELMRNGDGAGALRRLQAARDAWIVTEGPPTQGAPK